MTFLAATASAVRMDTMVPVIAEYLYSDDEPVVVHMRLIDVTSGGRVGFQFSRDLIDAVFATDREGEVFGHGDVTIELVDRGSCLRFGLMSVTNVRYYFMVESAPVRDFVIRSYMLVPRYAESDAIDVDAAIEKVLGA